MIKTKNVWVDLTDLWYWKGGFTGIQTVVDQYVQRYAKTGDVRFFIYEPPHRSFREIATSEWSARREAILGANRYTDNDAVLRERRPLKDVLRHYMAVLIKKILPRSVKRYLRAWTTRRRQDDRLVRRPHPFGENDTIMIIGGSWGDDFKGFAEGLAVIAKKINANIVHVVHDLIPIKYPNYFAPSQSYHRYMATMAGVASGFLAVSESTAKDLRSFLDDRGLKTPIEVFRLGEDFSHVDSVEKPNLPVDDRFILCVGTIEARKNHALLYNAVKLALQKGIDLPQVVIVGRVGWMSSETLRNLTVDPDLAGRVVVANNISDAQKAWLFKECLFTIYPSFYEGWGLPVAESLHNGKLCLCSNTSSLPEVGGSYAEYFSPYSAEDALGLMGDYSHSESKLRDKESIIAERPRFTWDDSFKVFLESTDALKRQAGLARK